MNYGGSEEEKEAREEFAKRLYVARAGRGWSTAEVGRRLGVDPSAVSNWEHCRCKPSLQTYEALLNLFPQVGGVLERFITVPNKPVGYGGAVHKGGSKKGQSHAPPLHPPVRPHQPVEEEMDKERITLTIPPTLLLKVASELVLERASREELIKSLRAAGMNDSSILDLVHRALP
jgi:transcriptional regulator with XRE-family HTH domain